MRYIGALLIAAAAVIAGLRKAAEHKNRVKLIFSVINALELMKNEIVTLRTPMLEAVYIIEKDKRLSEFCGELLKYGGAVSEKSFGEIWMDAAADKLSALPQGCLDAVKNLGTVLGRYDSQLQSAAIDRCMVILNVAGEEQSAQLRDRERLCVGAYGGLGLIAAIILI